MNRIEVNMTMFIDIESALTQLADACGVVGISFPKILATFIIDDIFWFKEGISDTLRLSLIDWLTKGED